jgi:hypothetical protein
MNLFNQLLPIFFFIYSLQDMSRFMLGLGTGIYLGTHYNFKPAIEYIETEAKVKFVEIKSMIEKKEAPEEIGIIQKMKKSLKLDSPQSKD